ncbi:MAG: AMP-binding protein [Bacteroidetes bacterium]|nr:AMP-binding protein [Bacteroidota bacterium]
MDSDKVAIINKDGKEISYHMLLQKIYIVSNVFNDVKENDRVLVFSEPRISYAYIAFAIWMKKATYTSFFLYYDTPDMWTWAINDLKPRVICVSEKRYPLLKQALEKTDIKPKIVLLNELEKIPINNDTPIANLQLDTSKIAFRPYTAGITTNHKVPELTLSNVKHVCDELTKTGFYKPDDKVLCYLPVFNNWVFLSTMIFPLLVGCTCVISPDDVPNVVKNIAKHKISVVIAVKRIYTELLQLLEQNKVYKRNSLKEKLISKINSKKLSKIAYRRVHNLLGNSIRYFLTVGAKIDEELYEPLLNIGFEVFEGYGMAETSSLMTYPASKRLRPECVGELLNDLQYKIINNELVIKGASVAKNYYNRGELNKVTFNNGWFFTNDVVEVCDDGMLEYKGRVGDEVVLKTGRVVVLAELERKLDRMQEYIRECGVYYDDDIFKCIVVPSQKMVDTFGTEDNYLILHSILRWKVVEHYNHGVQPYKRINNVVVTEKRLPRSTSGKIKRYMLKEYEERFDNLAFSPKALWKSQN